MVNRSIFPLEKLGVPPWWHGLRAVVIWLIIIGTLTLNTLSWVPHGARVHATLAFPWLPGFALLFTRPLVVRWGSFCFAFFFLLLGIANSQNLPVGPLPETPQSTIGYRTVASALTSVKARQGVTVSVVREWTIITDEANKEVWSFAPPSYPAYPAVVKRAVKARPEGGSEIIMLVLCEATKEACDNLVREFNSMNHRI